MIESQTADLARSMTIGEGSGFDTRQHLERARQQALERNFSDVFIVDIDAHHKEYQSWSEIIKYIEDPVLRHRAEAGFRQSGAGGGLLFHPPQNQSVSGRMYRHDRDRLELAANDVPRDITIKRREMESIGIDYQILFADRMLNLGLHPDAEIEVALSWAYSRWLTEELLPHDSKLKVMIYLPFNDPDASVRAIERFSDAPGVVGFLVTSTRYRPVHHNVYMKVYRALEERDMPLAFHASINRQERMFEDMNRFLSVHAISFVLSNMIHLTNMVINGIPERFPKLKIIFIESGLAWLPFMMQRLDTEYLMRTSEAPLLKKKPSEYISANFYYSSQPMEMDDLRALQFTMDMINAETQLMFASDYPHWDFNLPSQIWDLPFLSEQAKRNILGETARRVFTRLETD